MSLPLICITDGIVQSNFWALREVSDHTPEPTPESKPESTPKPTPEPTPKSLRIHLQQSLHLSLSLSLSLRQSLNLVDRDLLEDLRAKTASHWLASLKLLCGIVIALA